MKKLVYSCTIALILVLLPLSACSTETIITTPIPTTSVPPATEGEAPDDIMVTPFGPAYRANFHQAGVVNPWQPIQTVEVALASNTDVAYVIYRDYIETKAGETRNNIVIVRTPDWDIQSLNLYASDIPSGIEIAEKSRWHGPRIIAPVLIIEISQDVKPGEYTFEINLEIDGKDYGSVTCIIKIVE